MEIKGINLTNISVVDASVLTENLALYIDANNPSSYNGTGTVITDLSSNGRTQNLQNAAQYNVSGGIKSFDCTIGTYYITASVVGPVLPTAGFTYVDWAKMISSTATYRTLFRTDLYDHPLLINTGTNDLGMWDSNGLSFVTANYNVSSWANIWAQWSVVGDSAGQQFYINDVLVGSTSVSAAGNSHRYISLSNQAFGYIGNTLLYTSKLTELQIRRIYYKFRGYYSV